MHASLAFIGRACTVDDDEPPETPTHSSLDSQSDGLLDKYPQPLTELFLREVVEGALSQTTPIVILPILNKAVHFCQESTRGNKEKEPVLHRCHDTSPNDLSATDRTAHLTRLTLLHRLCDLVSNAVKVDLLARTFIELGSGLANLTRHVENTTSGEYGSLERCIRALFHIQNFSISPVIDQRIRCTQGNHSAFHHPTGPLASSQLVVLRVVCEGLRQSFSQMKQFNQDEHALCHFVHQMTHDHLTSPMYHSERDTPSHFLGVLNDRLSTASLIAAHQLAFSGLSLLAHTELIRFAYGDLWEMLRGVEELDILSNTVCAVRQHFRTLAIARTLTRTLSYSLPLPLIEQLMRQNLLCDPLLSVSPISVGYLFILIAHQRSIRLSCAVYRELFSLSNYNDCSDNEYVENTSDASKPKHTLLEAFRRYLREQYCRTAPEYLRTEYDFIAAFLDILSQSTNLLHQVEKLKVMCIAAADVQAKKADVPDGMQSKYSLSSSVSDIPHSFRAMSVEGKHGILIRRDSGERIFHPPLSNRYVNPSQNRKNLNFHLQDTLHRACTFDRYVATGTVLCPPVSLAEPNSQSAEACAPKQSTEASLSAGKHDGKKVVQWSDHREISTRHQVIGRFLEMIWYYTETLLNTLVLSPPASSVATRQACDLPPCKHTDHDPNVFVNHTAANADFTACLSMSPEKLRRLSRRIKETAKAAIFPPGLAPAIARQALKLDELAHRRRCYSDMMKRRICARFVTANLPAVSSCELHPTPQSSTSAPVSCDTICRDMRNFLEPSFLSECDLTLHDIACASATEKLIQRSLSLELPVLSDVWNESVQFIPLLQSKGFRVCLTSLLHLTLTCAREHATLISSDICQQVAHIEMQLKVFGLKLPANRQTVPPVSAQRMVTIQSAYEVNRRIGKIFHLLKHQMSSLIRHNHFYCAFNLDRLVKLVKQETDYAKLRVASQLAVLYTAEVFQLHTVIHSVLQLTDALTDGLRKSFSNSPAVNETVTCQRSHPQRLTLVLSDGIRVAAAIARLSKTSRWLLKLQVELRRSYIGICARFASTCEVLIAECWSNSLTALPSHPLNPKLLDEFLTVLQGTLPDKCSAIDLESVPPRSDNSSSCHFHQSVYTSVLRYVFHGFCRNWLEAVVSPNELNPPANSTLLRHHAASVKSLRDALFDRQTTIPVSLLTTLCECPGFCQLQASVPGPYEMLAGCEPLASHSDNLDKHSSGSEALSCASVCQRQFTALDPLSDRPRPNSCQPLQRVREKLTSHFNAPSDTLSALAAGVKSNLLTPLRSFAGIDNVPHRTISSHPSGPTLLNPFRSRTCSHKKPR